MRYMPKQALALLLSHTHAEPKRAAGVLQWEWVSAPPVRIPRHESGVPGPRETSQYTHTSKSHGTNLQSNTKWSIAQRDAKQARSQGTRCTGFRQTQAPGSARYLYGTPPSTCPPDGVCDGALAELDVEAGREHLGVLGRVGCPRDGGHH